MKTSLRCIERSETKTVYEVIDSDTGLLLRTITIDKIKGFGF